MGFSKKLVQPEPQLPSNKDTGNWGEKVAAEFLIAQGYAIRDTQWKGKHYEIDIVAQKGDRIVFCEVKTRKDDMFVDPVEAVNIKKRSKMMRGADTYLKAQKMPFGYQFDIITIVGSKESFKIEHIPDAFFPNPKSRS